MTLCARDLQNCALFTMYHCINMVRYDTLYTVQTSHNLKWDTQAKWKKTCVTRVHTQKSNFARACMCLFESVAEWIYSCWIIVNRRFIVLNRTL